MRRIISVSILVITLVVPAAAGVLPLLGCTLTSTGTTCNRGSTETVRVLPRIGDGLAVSTVLDGPLAVALVRNAGTFTAQIECQPRATDPFIPVAGQVCSASCIIPILPSCNDVRVNVTACSSCNVSVYVMKQE